MVLFESFKISFSMYSIIPMPNTNWSNKNMKYAICFFPLVGALIGGLLCLWSYLCVYFNVGNILFAAGSVLIPIIITGGIHMDGFCDTVDALSSHMPKERKLEILKDSHIGAFAVMWSVIYFILNFALWCEVKITQSSLVALSIMFILSRSLSGFSVSQFTCARENGVIVKFSNSCDQKVTRVLMYAYMAFVALALILLDIKLAVIIFVVAILVFLYYKKMVYNKFGGITGDLAGFFLQLCELFILCSIVIAQKLWG